MVSPSEQFEVFLGVDEGIKIARKLENKRVEAGAMKKASYTFSILVENFKSRASKITIIDQIPVSHDSDVDIFVEPRTTQPTSQTKDGQLTWEIELPAGGKKEIQLSYRVFYPASKPIFGLE